MQEQKPRVHIDAPAEKLRRLRELQKAAAEREKTLVVAERRELLEKCPHPLALAMYLDDKVVSTPAIELISKTWVGTLYRYNGRCTTSLGPQQGKAIEVTTPILTTAGWSTMGELRTGDFVFHPDGHPVRVVEAHPIRHDRPCYRVTTVDGRSVVVDGEHRWTVQDRRRKETVGPPGARTRSTFWVTLTTEQLLERGLHKNPYTRSNGATVAAPAYRLPDQHAVTSKPVDLPIDPYVLGAWLGDGDTDSAGFTCADPEIVHEIRAAGLTVEKGKSEYGWWISRRGAHRDAEDAARALCADGVPQREALRRVGLPVGTPLGITTENHSTRMPLDDPELYPPRIRSFKADLRALGVLHNKHIPEHYLTAGTEQRLALLQGLLDTDGSIFKVRSSARVEFTSIKEPLARDVLYLARSLGWRATLHDSDATLDGRVVGRRWRVCFTPDTSQPCPFRLSRKATRVQEPQARAGEAAALSIASIERVESRPVRCITVDREDGLFLIGRDLIPTHNSALSRWFAFWALLDNPDRRIVFASYSMGLARTSGRIIRSMVEQYGGPYGLELDQSHHDAADWQLKGYSGGCLSASPESTLTGRPADCLLLDDLLAGEAEANSPTVREKVQVWWESTARVRLAPGAPAISIGTRWNELDILQKFIDEGWDRINIPAVVDGETFDSLEGIEGARTEDGYLVSTRGTTPADWEQVKAESGPRAFNALFQGNPSPPEGGVFKREWFQNGRVSVAPPLHTVVIGVDPAETGTGDEAGIVVAGVADDNQIYLLADLSGKLSQAQWARRICLGALRYQVNRVVSERTLGLNTAIGDAWRIITRQANALAAAREAEAEQPVTYALDVLRAAGDDIAADPVQLRDVAGLEELIGLFPTTGPRVIIITPKFNKRIRAEAVTSLFEFGRAHIVGTLPVLEHEALTFQESQSKSPNRVDVMAHVLTHLDKARAKASVSRRPRHLQAVPTSTVTTLAR